MWTQVVFTWKQPFKNVVSDSTHHNQHSAFDPFHASDNCNYAQGETTRRRINTNCTCWWFSLAVFEVGELVRGEGLRVWSSAAVSPHWSVCWCHRETVLPADGGAALQSPPQPVHRPDGECSGHFTGERTDSEIMYLHFYFSCDSAESSRAGNMLEL